MNRYKRVRVLGKGSFGEAVLVKRRSDGEGFVIKRVDLSQLSRRERRDAEREAALLRRLQHPNIVRYEESFVDRGQLCIVMEHCPGGDLADRLKKQRGRPLDEAQVLDWIVQLCLALKHTHDRKILHRDIKSQNIFLMHNGIVKLGDFGIARVLSGTNDHAKTAIGTPYYLSPEICNEERYNHKSDIWSLGCVLYELAALRHPFEGRSMRQLVTNITRGQYKPVSSRYSQGLRDLIRQMLTVNPHKRPSVNAILKKPVVRARIEQFLSQTLQRDEFSHTVLHGHNVMRDPQPASAGAGAGAAAPARPSAAAAAADEDRRRQRQAAIRKFEREEQRAKDKAAADRERRAKAHLDRARAREEDARQREARQQAARDLLRQREERERAAAAKRREDAMAMAKRRADAQRRVAERERKAEARAKAEAEAEARAAAERRAARERLREEQAQLRAHRLQMKKKAAAEKARRRRAQREVEEREERLRRFEERRLRELEEEEAARRAKAIEDRRVAERARAERSRQAEQQQQRASREEQETRESRRARIAAFKDEWAGKEAELRAVAGGDAPVVQVDLDAAPSGLAELRAEYKRRRRLARAREAGAGAGAGAGAAPRQAIEEAPPAPPALEPTLRAPTPELEPTIRAPTPELEPTIRAPALDPTIRAAPPQPGGKKKRQPKPQPRSAGALALQQRVEAKRARAEAAAAAERDLRERREKFEAERAARAEAKRKADADRAARDRERKQRIQQRRSRLADVKRAALAADEPPPPVASPPAAAAEGKEDGDNEDAAVVSERAAKREQERAAMRANIAARRRALAEARRHSLEPRELQEAADRAAAAFVAPAADPAPAPAPAPALPAVAEESPVDAPVPDDAPKEIPDKPKLSRRLSVDSGVREHILKQRAALKVQKAKRSSVWDNVEIVAPPGAPPVAPPPALVSAVSTPALAGAPPSGEDSPDLDHETAFVAVEVADFVDAGGAELPSWARDASDRVDVGVEAKDDDDDSEDDELEITDPEEQEDEVDALVHREDPGAEAEFTTMLVKLREALDVPESSDEDEEDADAPEPEAADLELDLDLREVEAAEEDARIEAEERRAPPVLPRGGRKDVGAAVDASRAEALAQRIEAMRVYLEESLGDGLFAEAYRLLSQLRAAREQPAEIDVQLRALLAPDSLPQLPVLHMLVDSEDKFDRLG